MTSAITDSETRLLMFLEILSAMGGLSDASDHNNWIQAFCGEHEGREPDTFNLGEQRGYTRVSHDNRFDTSTVRLTDEGRAFLEAAKLQDAGAGHG